MKYKTNYVESQCFDFHRHPCGCDRPRPPHDCINPNRPPHGGCWCDNPAWNNPWFNPFPPQTPCFPQNPQFPCPPSFCNPCPTGCCQPNCGCLNFQIPLSFLYLYAGYMIGNSKDKC